MDCWAGGLHLATGGLGMATCARSSAACASLSCCLSVAFSATCSLTFSRRPAIVASCSAMRLSLASSLSATTARAAISLHLLREQNSLFGPRRLEAVVARHWGFAQHQPGGTTASATSHGSHSRAASIIFSISLHALAFSDDNS